MHPGGACASWLAPLLTVRTGRVRPAGGRGGAVRSLRPPPTGAGGGSHAPLRCTRQLCTLGSVRKLVGAPADGANRPRPPCRGARGAVRSLRPPPTGAGGGSHAPLRCTRQLCTLRKLVGAPADGANRPRPPCRGARWAVRSLRPWFARSPQVHKAAVHPGGACASWLAPLLTVRTGRVRPAGGRGGRSGACARRPRAREAVRTLPSGAQGSCAPSWICFVERVYY